MVRMDGSVVPFAESGKWQTLAQNAVIDHVLGTRAAKRKGRRMAALPVVLLSVYRFRLLR